MSERLAKVDIRDVPCGSCVEGYDGPHVCEAPDYCPCDRAAAHMPTNRPTPTDPTKETR